MNDLKLFDRVYLVGRGSWGGLLPLTAKLDCNIYLIDGGGELALIDNGEAFNLVKLKKNILAAGLDFNKIKKLIITHDHVDHTANTWLLKKILDAKVFAGRGSYFFLKPDVYVKTGDKIKVGEVTLNVYNTPGHTPDSLCLEANMESKKLLFTGDTAIGDQPWKSKGVVGWYNTAWGSDIKKFKISIKFIKKLSPDIILPGHGLPQMTRKKCAKALENCQKRLAKLGKRPEFESLIPFTFDLKGNKELLVNVKISKRKKRLS